MLTGILAVCATLVVIGVVAGNNEEADSTSRHRNEAARSSSCYTGGIASDSDRRAGKIPECSRYRR